MINFFKKLFAAIFGTKKKPSPYYEKPIKEEPIVLLDEMKMPKESYMTAEQLKMEKKPLVEMVQVPGQPNFPKSNFFPFKGRKKWQMRNNRLHIEYNGTAHQSGSNFSLKRNEMGKVIGIDKPGSMYKGKIDSLRCTKIEKAQHTIRYLRHSIERAVFTDKDGNQYQLI